MSNAGNKNRANWREKCRECLSKYLAERLGISIPPDEVRLRPTDKDLYRWRVRSPALSYLFQKHLSNHSTGAYIRLVRGVGKAFDAVLAKAEDNAMDDEEDTASSSAGQYLGQGDFIPSDFKEMEANITENEVTKANDKNHWESVVEATIATNNALMDDLESVRKANIQLQGVVRQLLTKTKSYKSRIIWLEGHLESHSEEVLKVIKRFKEEMIYRPPVPPAEIAKFEKKMD
ncbi:hypothetical protein MauCBS54593_006158 [Microsporum audouinii]